MALAGMLWCIAVLLATSVAAIGLARHRSANVLVYGAALAASAIALLAAWPQAQTSPAGMEAGRARSSGDAPGCL